jgi:hypothetical protein
MHSTPHVELAIVVVSYAKAEPLIEPNRGISLHDAERERFACLRGLLN